MTDDLPTGTAAGTAVAPAPQQGDVLPAAARTPDARTPGKYDEELDRLFGAGGPLAPNVGTYKPRQSQTEMAKAIAQAIPDVLLVLDAQGRYVEVLSPDDSALSASAPQLLGKRLGVCDPHDRV